MATMKRVLFAFSLAMLTGPFVQLGPAQQANATAQEHAARANEALKSGHPEKAIPEFQALIALEPDNVDAQANLGVLLYFHGDLNAAVTPLRTAVKLNPDLPKIRALLGLAEAGLGQTDAAAVDLKLAL